MPVRAVRLAPVTLVYLVRTVAAGVNPAAAGRRAIVLEREIIVELLAVVRVAVLVVGFDDAGREFRLGRGFPAVDLGQDRLGFRFAFLVLGIPPVQRAERFVHGIVGRVGLGDQPFGELVGEPRLALGVARRLDGFLAPLEQALGVGERALLLGRARRRA